MKSTDSIKLKRGNKDIVLKKVSDRFAVRLKKGVAKEKSINAISRSDLEGAPRHIDSDDFESMEVYAIQSDKMENTVNKLRDIPENEVVTHLYAAEETPEGAFIPTGSMTLQFSPELKKQEQEEILRTYGLEITKDLDYLMNGYIVRLTSASTKNPLKIALELQNMKGILIAEPDLSFKVSFKHIPTDTLYPEQWHLNNRGHRTGLLAGADVKAEAAWDITLGSRNICICVMDDGFDLEHPDFNSSGKIIAPKDFGDNDSDPRPVLSSDNHGTACAGVALADQNGTGVVGLSPGCSFMPVRTSPWLSDAAIEDLFQYAIDNFADVISCSWSAAAAYFPLSSRMNAIIHKAATQGRANGKGCVILFAAGNESAPLNDDTHHQGFALHPDVITVAASNSLDEQSYYSNFGKEITICAPSSGYPGRGVVTTDRTGSSGYDTDDFTYSFGGTSSSTPLCAGLAGLILSVDPDLTSAEVRSLMMNTADKIDLTDGNYDENGHSEKYGYGRINAHAAVEQALGARQPETPPQTLYVEHRIKTPIPDLGEMSDTLPFPIDAEVIEIEVYLNINHTYRGDLSVTLQAPGQEEITLIRRTGGSEDDIIETLRSTNEPEVFRSLIGIPARGDWTIRITDNAPLDKGILNKWGIAITYY